MTDDIRDLTRVLAVLVLATVLASVVSMGTFLQAGNLHNLFHQNLIIALVALAQFYVVLTGGIDLSLAAVAALSSVVVVLMQDFGLPISLLAAVAAGTTVGLVNGLLVSIFRLPAFLVTLGTMQIVYSLAKVLSGGGTIQSGAGGSAVSPILKSLFVEAPLGLSNAMLTVILVAGFSVAFFRTAQGHFLYLVGSNDRAAFIAGINVGRMRVAAYAIAGAIASLAGCLFVARVGYGDPQAGGMILLLDSIAAVTVGGASLFGGSGTVLATLAGVLIIGVFNNLLNMVGIPATMQPAIKGAVILLAVFAYSHQFGALRDIKRRFFTKKKM